MYLRLRSEKPLVLRLQAFDSGFPFAPFSCGRTVWNPQTTRNKASTKIDMAALEKHVEDYPDAYQYERASALGVSPNCILYAFDRLQFFAKKTITEFGNR